MCVMIGEEEIGGGGGGDALLCAVCGQRNPPVRVWIPVLW